MQNRINPSYLQDQLTALMESSRNMTRTLNEFHAQQCSKCRQLEQRVAEKDAIIDELRQQAMPMRRSSGPHDDEQCLRSTYISDRQQAEIDSRLLEAMQGQQRWKDKYNEVVEDMELIKSQMSCYEKDFALERQDRANARGELADVNTKLDVANRTLFDRSNELLDARAVVDAQNKQIQSLTDELYALRLQLQYVPGRHGRPVPIEAARPADVAAARRSRAALPPQQLAPMPAAYWPANYLYEIPRDETDYVAPQQPRRSSSPRDAADLDLVEDCTPLKLNNAASSTAANRANAAASLTLSSDPLQCSRSQQQQQPPRRRDQSS